MSITSVQDSRGFFVLPQGYEGGGYYTYGTPGEGRGQYTHPATISLISLIAAMWAGIDERKFGIGNVSLADGVKPTDHSSHRSGLEVDIRPLRKDGRRLACPIWDSQYDRAGTDKLIALFVKSPFVREILFNDKTIRGVKYAKDHDNHFHVALNPVAKP